jgi:hypothetical protein
VILSNERYSHVISWMVSRHAPLISCNWSWSHIACGKNEKADK